jgi:hypothetical protein
MCFICGGFELKPEAKRGWFNVMLTLMLLINMCLVLYEGSFKSVGIGEWWDELKNGQKLKLGDAQHPKKYPRITSIKAWGCPRDTPSSSAKIRSPFNILYFYCFMHYVFFLERQLFYFSVFFSFVCCNKWLDPNKFLLEKLSSFSFAKNTSFFILIISMSVLFFSNCV